MHAWFAARFLSGYELAAAHKADHGEPGARGFCPIEYRRWFHRGKYHERIYPVLAGYAFIEMAKGDIVRWHEVAALKGFYGFIGGAVPVPARAGVGAGVEALIARSTDDWVLQAAVLRQERIWLRRGDQVRVAEGVLENCTGQVEWVRPRDGGAVAQVTVRGFFDIEMRVEIPLDYLELLDKTQHKQKDSLLDLPVVRPAEIFSLPRVALAV
jgi:transcription antitermination factor NusG